MAAAAVNALLSPFLLLFLVIYFFMKHAERFYHSPGKTG
jgi:autophagy-related protein 9